MALLVAYRPNYGAVCDTLGNEEDKYAWNRRAENDHVMDMNAFAVQAKTVSMSVENKNKNNPYETKDACESANSNSLLSTLKALAGEAVQRSAAKWDRTNKHNCNYRYRRD
jgi:hypothetical protein